MDLDEEDDMGINKDFFFIDEIGDYTEFRNQHQRVPKAQNGEAENNPDRNNRAWIRQGRLEVPSESHNFRRPRPKRTVSVFDEDEVLEDEMPSALEDKVDGDYDLENDGNTSRSEDEDDDDDDDNN